MANWNQVIRPNKRPFGNYDQSHTSIRKLLYIQKVRQIVYYKNILDQFAFCHI